MPPENGPFHCGGCEYFSSPNDCKLVEGHIEAEGCCNLYQKAEQKTNRDDMKVKLKFSAKGDSSELKSAAPGLKKISELIGSSNKKKRPMGAT